MAGQKVMNRNNQKLYFALILLRTIRCQHRVNKDPHIHASYKFTVQCLSRNVKAWSGYQYKTIKDYHFIIHSSQTRGCVKSSRTQEKAVVSNILENWRYTL
jgi:hypothetical protein